MTGMVARAFGTAAVLALALLALSSVAQAAEIGRCVNTPRGEYANAGCTDQAALPHSGSYEWEAAPSSITATFGTAVGETPSIPATTTCKAGTAVGTVTGPKTNHAVDTFTGCEAAGKQCHTLNTGTAGEIRTFTLEGTLIEHGEKGLSNEEPIPGEVWIEFANQHGTEAPRLETYLCEGIGYFLLRQWVGTSITPLNVMTSALTQNYQEGTGEQSLLSTGCEKSNFTSCYWENQAATFSAESTIFPSEAAEIRTDEPPAEVPEIAAPAAVQVTTETATVSGYVVPNGHELAECDFEYGYSEEGPFESTPCSSLPGSGHERVQVSAHLSGLTVGSNLYLRIHVYFGEGLDSPFNVFSTLTSSASGSTTEPAVPAKATDGQLSVEASGGTGAVTIGHYGEEAIGGPPLVNGKGAYFQIYRSPEATFTKVQYSDCELGGARTLWWDDPATGWEPITEPTAVYDEATHCITVTATANSRPSVEELADPRHVGGPAASEEYGKCEPAKHGHFEDAACTKEKFKENGGITSYKGKYEWMAAPVSCYPQKKGRYGDSGCTSPDEKKGKPKGKYEAGQSTFTGSGGSATLDAVGLAGVECQGSTSTGVLRAPNEALLQITFTGCTSEFEKCESGGQAGTIVTEPLESYSYEESSQYFTVLAGNPIMSFSCGHARLTLSGSAGGLLSASINTSSASSESAFGEGRGVQGLELEEPQGETYPATLTSTFQTVDAQAIELRAKP